MYFSLELFVFLLRALLDLLFYFLDEWFYYTCLTFNFRFGCNRVLTGSLIICYSNKSKIESFVFNLFIFNNKIKNYKVYKQIKINQHSLHRPSTIWGKHVSEKPIIPTWFPSTILLTSNFLKSPSAFILIALTFSLFFSMLFNKRSNGLSLSSA